MKKEDLMKLLRNPAKFRQDKQVNPQAAAAAESGRSAARKKQDMVLLGVTAGVVFLLLVTWLIMNAAQSRADNIAASLDPEQLKGLTVENTTFDPSVGSVTYIQVQEGQNRNASVSNLGTTLPIISRFNYQAFTPDNYELVGAAPWALTTNFASNIQDPDLMLYLLSNDNMIKAFLARPDVAPLLEDPQLLLAFTQDNSAMEEFFDSDTVKAVVANEKMLRMVAGSRFMSYLLISKSGKYFREHPQQAAAAIAANPYLSQLQKNRNVQTAVRENPYLKNIANILLAPAAARQTAAKKTSAKRVSRNTKK